MTTELIDKIYDKLANNDGGFEPTDAIDMWVDNTEKAVYFSTTDTSTPIGEDRFFKLKLTEMTLDEDGRLIDEDSELFTDYVLAFADLCVNINSGRGTERLTKRVAKLEKELTKRGLLTDKDIERLRA